MDMLYFLSSARPKSGGPLVLPIIIIVCVLYQCLLSRRILIPHKRTHIYCQSQMCCVGVQLKLVSLITGDLGRLREGCSRVTCQTQRCRDFEAFALMLDLVGLSFDKQNSCFGIRHVCIQNIILFSLINYSKLKSKLFIQLNILQ